MHSNGICVCWGSTCSVLFYVVLCCVVLGGNGICSCGFKFPAFVLLRYGDVDFDFDGTGMGWDADGMRWDGMFFDDRGSTVSNVSWIKLVQMEGYSLIRVIGLFASLSRDRDIDDLRWFHWSLAEVLIYVGLGLGSRGMKGQERIFSISYLGKY